MIDRPPGYEASAALLLKGRVLEFLDNVDNMR